MSPGPLASAVFPAMFLEPPAPGSRLSHDLDTGEWNDRHRQLLFRAELDVGYRIVVARCGRLA
jgi:hypothetical protein